jgi:hypothetical protein
MNQVLAGPTWTGVTRRRPLPAGSVAVYRAHIIVNGKFTMKAP